MELALVLLEFDECLSAFYGLSWRGHYFFDGSGRMGCDICLHFHGFQHNQQVIYLEILPNLDIHPLHNPCDGTAADLIVGQAVRNRMHRQRLGRGRYDWFRLDSGGQFLERVRHPDFLSFQYVYVNDIFISVDGQDQLHGMIPYLVVLNVWDDWMETRPS